MASLSNNKEAEIIQAFNSSSKYLDNHSNIDNPYIEGMMGRIYAHKIQFNNSKATDTEALFLELPFSILSGLVLWKIYDKYEGISKSFEPNMERARNLDLFCFIFQRSPLPTPHTCPI